MNIIARLGDFFKRSIYSSPDDIEKPYHKVVNLLLKLLSIAFVVLGLWLNLVATDIYYKEAMSSKSSQSLSKQTGQMATDNKSSAPSLTGQPAQQTEDNLETEQTYNRIVSLNMFGIGFILVGIFIALVLLVRYIAFTLPDRIYLRCYANNGQPKEQEKNNCGCE